MLGLAPLAAATLSDDGDRLPWSQASAVGEVALGGSAAGDAITGSGSQDTTLVVAGAVASIGNIHGRGAGSLSAAGNANAIGSIAAIAARTFTAITTAATTPRTAGSIEGVIEFSGQTAGRTEGSCELRALWNWHGVASAQCATLAGGSGLLETSGGALGSASLQSGVAGSITFARQLASDSVVEGAASRGMEIDGTSDGAAQTLGVATASVTLTGRAAAGGAQRAAANGAMALGRASQVKTVVVGRAASLGPALFGSAIGTTLDARFVDIAGRLGLRVSASAALEAHAVADAVVEVSLDAFGTIKSRSVITGGFFLAPELNAGVLATGEANREIGLAGTARAAAVTATDVAAVKLEVTGGSEARGASVGSVRHGLAVSGHAELASSVSAGASAAIPLSLGAVIANGVGAVGAAQVPMRGATRFVTDVAAVAADHLELFGQSACVTAPIARADEQFDTACGATGGIASLGQGRGALKVARDVAGDVDVFGDSTRQISLRGAASARTTSTGETSNSVVEVTGWGVTRATTAAEATPSIAFSGHAQSRVTGVATVETTLDWRIRSEATAPRSAQSRGTLSLVGRGQVRSAVLGTATADTLAIESRLGGQTGVAARLNAWPDLEGSARARIDTDARGAGQASVARDSDADVQVAGDAARLLPIVGTSAGALVARATRADGAVVLGGIATARAQTAASLPKGATLDLQSHATGATRAQAISTGHVAFIRLGLGDVLVAAGAARGIALLGSAQAGNVTRAAANLPLAPQLAGSATNLIRVEFVTRDMGAAGRGGAMVGVSGKAVAQDLGLVAVVQALRAPPALRRSEPPKYGLSGRLSPTSSGRIMRG